MFLITLQNVESNVYLFADDAKIHKSINSLNDHNILQHDIDNLTKWSSNWHLTLNSDKCKVLKVAKKTFKEYDNVMQNYTLQFILPGERLGSYFKFEAAL